MGLYSKLILCGFVVSFITIQGAHADYSIILSKTCLTMIQANISTACPTYEELNILYPDTSIAEVSGGFVDWPYYHREPAPYKDHYEYYKQLDMNNITWLDPPADIIEGMPRIIIAASDFTYKIIDQNITDSSVLVGQNRYVSSTCTYIIISATNWYFLLGDSIRLLSNDCDPSYTNFNEEIIRTWERTKHDISTSAKWILDTWIKETKELAKQYLIGK